MAQKKSKFRMFTVTIIILAVLGLGYLAFNYFFTSFAEKYNQEAESVVNVVNLPLKIEEKDKIISSLKSLEKFGDWPIKNVELTVERGNPFRKMNIQE